MAKTLVQELAEWKAEMESRIAAVEKQPRLSNASIDDETVRLKEGERVKGLLGRQPDGSHGSRVVESPAQPTPDAPAVSVGKGGVVAVRWSGGADAPVPLVHGHVEVQAQSPSDADWQVVGTIRDRDGGATTFAADESGTTQVRLVMVGQDRVTRSEASEVSTVEVALPVNAADVEDRVQQTEDDINDGLNNLDTELRTEIETAAGNAIQRSTSAPTAADGEGIIPGQRWEQWTSLDVGGRITGTWVWDGSAWIESGLDETYLPRVAIGQGTYGEMDGDRLAAQTVTSNKLLVGDWENMVSDTRYTIWGEGGWGGPIDSDPGLRVEQGTEGREFTALVIEDTDVNVSYGMWDVNPSDEFVVAADVFLSDGLTANDMFVFWMRGLYEDGSWARSQNIARQVSPGDWVGWKRVAFPFTTRSSTTAGEIMQLAIRTSGLSGKLAVANVMLRRRLQGEMIVDGAVKAVHLEASESMSTRLVESVNAKIVNLDTNALVANTGFVADLEAHGITLSSEVNDRRFEVSGEGWQLTDTTTGETLASVGVDGDFMATNASLTGSFQTSYPNGAGVTISRGDITYWSQDSGQYEDIVGTPYVRFTPRNGEKDRDPVIATRGQRLFMTGGSDPDNGPQPVVVDGDLEAGQIWVNATLSTPSVFLDQSGSYGSISPTNGMILSSEQSQPTGIKRHYDTGRTTLVGRMDYETPTTMVNFGDIGIGEGWTLNPGAQMRIELSYGSPAPHGTRIPVASPRVSHGNWGWGNSTALAFAVTKESAGGFGVVGVAPTANNSTVGFHVTYSWAWK